MQKNYLKGSRFKMNKKLFHSSLYFGFVLAFLLIGCNLGSLKIGEVRLGMFGDNSDARIAYTFSTFSGFENGSQRLESGESFQLHYEATLGKGSVLIELQDPNGEVVWQKSLQEHTQGSETIAAEITGNYTIIVQAKDAGGSFDVSWELD
jgi:hypothetical protein